jgi:hypothetical protein
MDATDRQLLIEQLQRDNDESRAEIERRAAERENDPAGHDRREREHQQLEAERATAAISHAAISHEEWADRIRNAYAQKNDEPAALVYRRYENSQTPSAADDATGLFDSNPPAENEFEAAVDVFAAAVERRLRDLEGELVTRDARIATLEGKLDALLTLLGTGKPPKKLWVP